MNFPITSINTSIDMDTNSNTGYYYFITNCSTNSIVVQLPALQYCFNGQTFRFVRQDSNLLTTITFTAKSGTTVNNVTSVIAALKTNVELTYFNGNWIALVLSFA